MLEVAFDMALHTVPNFAIQSGDTMIQFFFPASLLGGAKTTLKYIPILPMAVCLLITSIRVVRASQTVLRSAHIRFFANPDREARMTSTINIDDRDPSITYSSGWFLMGVPAEEDGTTHGANPPGPQASFTFSGNPEWRSHFVVC